MGGLRRGGLGVGVCVCVGTEPLAGVLCAVGVAGEVAEEDGVEVGPVEREQASFSGGTDEGT